MYIRFEEACGRWRPSKVLELRIWPLA